VAALLCEDRRVWEHERVNGAIAGALGCAFIGRGREEGRRPSNNVH
jgi:hypothetical protein